MHIRLLILIWVLAVAGLGGVSIPADNQQEDSNVNIVEEFKSKVYPLLMREEGGCFDCHSSGGNSELVFSGNVEEDLHMLIDGQYLSESGPGSLVARLANTNEKLRMPKDGDAWSRTEIDQLAAFLQSLEKDRPSGDQAADERFPRALLLPYHGDQSGKIDNQFISYRQLKAKIAVVFDDDWVRGGKDLFAENVALFGGADFKKRFNESREPSAAFLTGLEMLANDVAHHAYARRHGPFAQWPEFEKSPLETASPTSEYCEAIECLYRKVLFRSPTSVELDEAYRLLQEIYRARDLIRDRNHQLTFELTVTDPLTHFQRKQFVEIPVNGDRLEVWQQIVNQSGEAASEDEPLLKCVIGPVVELHPETAAQRLVIHNLGTNQNVSFAGVEISRVDGEVDSVQTISVSSSEVQVDGAWELVDRGGAKSLEDRNNHKGQSTITVPLTVANAGKYRLTLLWRADPGNARNVLVELFAKGAGNQLVSPIKATIPEPGEAHFYYDCGEDAVAFFQPEPAFQFDLNSYVEISNRGTRKRVTAGAVEFLQHPDSVHKILIDSLQAEGNSGWSRFDAGRFNAYNVKGQKLHDDNKQKGELSLRYAPRAKLPIDKPEENPQPAWNPDEFYDVRIYFPGKVDQEPQVPVVVKAVRSSPLIQLQYPLIAKSDAKVKLDASASYTVQRSELRYSWRQISGSPVELREAEQPTVEFIVPRPDIDQFAWSSLCAGLMRHPDFLFTRPPSFFLTASEQDKQHMQLLKIALDLVGRPPTTEEIRKLNKGLRIPDFVDLYLDSSEFRDFYFHRIRLMLESHGTELDDEPARLWSYVAFNDRPFQEILTGEYSVDTEFKRKERPVYYGKTGLLTTAGFVHGKPGLPHYNYAAQVSMLFLGYVYEVPDEIVEQREGVTALGTTDPDSACYSCHKILTPLAFQRMNWTDDGVFRTRDENDLPIDASDRGCVTEYPFAGVGMVAFANQAVRKERFIRTMINTHVNFYFGRPMRHRQDERMLYRRLWDNVHANEFKIRELIRAIVTSPEYLDGGSKPVQAE